MEGLGNLFKEKREALGLTLSDVSEEIKIGVNFLQAIEKDDFGKLPKGVYARLFLKKYAQFLELDTNEVLKKFYEFAKVTPDDNSNIVLRERDKFIAATESSYSVKLIIFLFFLLLILSSFLYYFFIRNNGFESLKSKIFIHEITKKENLQKEKKVEKLPKKEETTFKESVNPERFEEVRLLAEGKCWIKVSVDGGEEKEYMLNSDEVKIKFKKEINLILGNAGAIDMYINGKKCAPLGSPGEVKSFTIDKENEKSFLEENKSNGN